MFKVIDNFLPESYSNQILSDVKRELQWFYSSSTSKQVNEQPLSYVVDENTFDYGQFECVVKSSYRGFKPQHPTYFEFIKPMMYIAQNHVDRKIISIHRAKINLLLQQPLAPDNHYNIAHKDTNLLNHYSMVYYIDDSDGDTFLFNEFWGDKLPEKLTLFNRVSPKKNRAVIFDSNRFHASSNPRINRERYVINFVLSVI